jgi:hypothetical protein
MLSLPKVLLFFFLFAFGVAPRVWCQSADLRKDAAFFKKKLPEFQHWLKTNKLHRMFQVDSVGVTAQQVTLFLRPAYRGKHVCDSIQCAWRQLEQQNKRYNGQAFHERLLHKWAFLAEVREEQAQVVVRCHNPPHFMARVTSSSGKVGVEERNMRSVAVVSVETPAALAGINSGENSAIISASKVNAVCSKARQFLTKYYQGRGTPVLWKAKIDDSYAFWDEFILEVTHLSNEIVSDNYFEYHRVYIKGIQKGDDVELTWEFQGKYGSGILFPPRKNDYKDLETKYKSNLEAYQKKMFKKLLDYLRP